MHPVRCPHTRGGEPLPLQVGQGQVLVVPTPVGVNRSALEVATRQGGRCPHTRGGEPVRTALNRQAKELSPHPWG